MDESKLRRCFVCPRCGRYAAPITSMGRWQCSYHPGEYDVDKGYSCCGQKVRSLRINPTCTMLGQQERYVPPPRGCTPCDCGTDLSSVHIQDIAHLVDIIDIDKWKGFIYPTLYRTKNAHDNSL